MTANYFSWPGANDDLIMVSDFNGKNPVSHHKHEFVEIVFIMKGTCIHNYLGVETPLIPGDVFIVVPHEEHSYTINSETNICNLIFYPGILNTEWPELKEMRGVYNFIMIEPFFRFETNSNQVFQLQPKELTYVESLLNIIRDEQKSRQKGYRLVQKANLINLLAFIGRAWERIFHEHTTEYDRKRHILTDAINYIRDNMQEDLNVSDIAARVFLSTDYFRKVFKEVTGLSPVEYVNNFRIAKAEVLLKDTVNTIGEVSELVGINDTNYFSKLFRATKGCTPTEYRKKYVLY
jgi:AraC-like DNA-binding protein